MSSWRLKLYPVRKFPPITKESTGVETQCAHPPGLQQSTKVDREKTPQVLFIFVLQYRYSKTCLAVYGHVIYAYLYAYACVA